MDKHNYSAPVSLKNIQVTDTFWKGEMELVRKEVIPYQWDALNDRVEGAAPSFCMHNFKAAGKLNREKKEEVYESKLRFFTNITHEFCTPLTLIYGPCEKILAYPQSDSYIRKYGKMIQQNTEKLNSLILELLEFRRLETGHKALSIQRLPA